MNKKILEINPNHSIITKLRDGLESNDDGTNNSLIWLLYDTALLSSGYSLPDPNSLSKRIHQLIKLGLNIDVEDGEKHDDIPDLPDDTEDSTNTEEQVNEESTMEEVD